MFLPLWAGVPLPEAEIRKIIEQHMLNPNEFFGEKPFPSVSYDDPTYDPNGYWRGRIWPHFVYWMVQTLWRYGYHAEAELTADRILDLFRATPWLHENYNSATGSGWDPERKIGFPDYNWSDATVIELLLERYKEPLF
jgi:glycogen debranching enzyme